VFPQRILVYFGFCLAETRFISFDSIHFTPNACTRADILSVGFVAYCFAILS
jgi:hypothetical protein